MQKLAQVRITTTKVNKSPFITFKNPEFITQQSQDHGRNNATKRITFNGGECRLSGEQAIPIYDTVGKDLRHPHCQTYLGHRVSDRNPYAGIMTIHAFALRW
uniref:DNA-directed RNA polymerase n=1 Tax=Steinernema glaseri TaxID=37863 RepID=A0A1I7YB05_9BILA